jgi:hypothetical protein
MSYYFEKPIVDTKEIFTKFLITTISPLLYEGFCSIYNKAMKTEQTYIEGAKVDSSIENPGVLKIFMFLLTGVDKMSDTMIEYETSRIKDNSKCADMFDDLVQSVIKSYIIVLTYTASGKRCKIVDDEHHKKVTSKIFIHKCYSECARIFYDHPTLFWHEFGNHELKENQRIIYQLIKEGIKNAINRCIPMKEILSTYLSNDYSETEVDASRGDYINVKDMIKRDLLPPEVKDEGGVRNILVDEESSMLNHDFNLNEQDGDDLTALIFGNRHMQQTISEIEKPQLKISSEKKPDKILSDKKSEKGVEKLTSEKGVEKIASEKKSEKMEELEFDINKILSKTKKGKTSEHILKEAMNATKVEEDINIEKSYNNADNYYGEFV